MAKTKQNKTLKSKSGPIPKSVFPVVIIPCDISRRGNSQPPLQLYTQFLNYNFVLQRPQVSNGPEIKSLPTLHLDNYSKDQ